MAYQSVTTGIVRLTRMHLFPSNGEDAPQKIRASLLLPKSDTLTMRRINSAIADTMGHALKTKWRDVYLGNIRMPIMDGDGLRGDGTAFEPECAGHHVIVATSYKKPDIVDDKLNPLSSEEIYDGIYAYVSVSFHPFVYSDNTPAIGCTLGPIMKIADGPYIPRNLTPVQQAFSSIVDVKTEKTLSHKKTSDSKAKTRKETPQPEPPVSNDAETPPWKEDGFQSLMETLKDRKLSLDELREAVNNAQASGAQLSKDE